MRTASIDAGVLANDVDVDQVELSATVISPPVHGNLTLNANGSFTYAPNADFHGTDEFTYRASDGAASSQPATVTISVRPVNDPPVGNDEGYSVDEDGELTVPPSGVLSNDTDVDCPDASSRERKGASPPVASGPVAVGPEDRGRGP